VATGGGGVALGLVPELQPTKKVVAKRQATARTRRFDRWISKRLRARVTDGKVTRLIAQFLKAGVLADGFMLPTDKGTPQGGVISPLLANIALGIIEERYERWNTPSSKTTGSPQE
jgi:hypothetical protein